MTLFLQYSKLWLRYLSSLFKVIPTITCPYEGQTSVGSFPLKSKNIFPKDLRIQVDLRASSNKMVLNRDVCPLDSGLVFDNHMIKTDKNEAGQNKTKMNSYNYA